MLMKGSLVLYEGPLGTGRLNRRPLTISPEGWEGMTIPICPELKRVNWSSLGPRSKAFNLKLI